VLLSLQLAHVHGGSDELIVDGAAVVAAAYMRSLISLSLRLEPCLLEPLLEPVEGD
jgi:hypothetical protein